MNLDERKKELKEIALTKYTSGGTVFILINEGSIDHIINKINDDITLTNSKAIIKKGFLTGNEQFISILVGMISYFSSNFIVLKDKESALAYILEQTIPNFLLCKNYWGDNNFITYYTKNMNKLFVKNFYDNIKFIYDEYYDFFNSININNKLNINRIKDTNLLLNFMVKLVWCNCINNQFSIIYVFSNYKYRIKYLKENSKKERKFADYLIYKDYIMHWDSLIKGYKKNIEYIEKILE